MNAGRALVTSTALQPAPHARAIAAIDLAEPALEVGFLPRDHAVADDEGEGHERHHRPEAVEGDGETDERQHHAEGDGIAREAVAPGVDDGYGGPVGGHVRAGPRDGG